MTIQPNLSVPNMHPGKFTPNKTGLGVCKLKSPATPIYWGWERRAEGQGWHLPCLLLNISSLVL